MTATTKIRAMASSSQCMHRKDRTMAPLRHPREQAHVAWDALFCMCVLKND
jgi:hypothetical protein